MKKLPLSPAPTLRDVARAAGVSQSAVSRTFTDGASISSRMRARVLKAADALGYRPNLLARSLITGRSKLIGVAAGNLENNLFGYVLDLLSARLSNLGYQLMVYTAQPNSAANEAQLDEFLHYKIRGMVLLSLPLPESVAARCDREGTPVVYFNQPVEPGGVAFTVEGQTEEGPRQIARFLFEGGGYRRIAFMAGAAGARSSMRREAAFTDELVRLGAPPPIRETGEYDHALAMAAARRLLTRPDPPDAIFCANDQMALATIAIAQGEFGLKVGRDLAVVGFGDVPMASWPNFSLTTFALPLSAMVDQVVRFLLEGHELPPEQRRVVLAGRLIIRDSAPTRAMSVHRRVRSAVSRTTSSPRS